MLVVHGATMRAATLTDTKACACASLAASAAPNARRNRPAFIARDASVAWIMELRTVEPDRRVRKAGAREKIARDHYGKYRTWG